MYQVMVNNASDLNSNFSEREGKNPPDSQGIHQNDEEAIFKAAAPYYLSNRELILYSGRWGGLDVGRSMGFSPFIWIPHILNHC